MNKTIDLIGGIIIIAVFGLVVAGVLALTSWIIGYSVIFLLEIPFGGVEAGFWAEFMTGAGIVLIIMLIAIQREMGKMDW